MIERIDRRTALVATGLLGLSVATRDLTDGEAVPIPSAGAEGLRARAERKGLLVGAAVLGSRLAKDRRLAAALQSDANVLVPEVELKWTPIQPRRGELTFDLFEPIRAFAEVNAMKIRGHTLAWYREVPDWARAALAPMTASAAGDWLERHVRTIVDRWKGKLIHWDVVNEPIDDRQRLTDSFWATKLGEHYIDIAFAAAHEADPDTLLVLNIDMIEMDDAEQEQRRKMLLGLLERLLKRGVPVQALGVEGHLRADKGFNESQYGRFLKQVTGMGLKVIITEFDVSDQGVVGTAAMRDQVTAGLGKAFLDVSFDSRQCLGVLSWSQCDRYSWLRSVAHAQRIDGSPLRPGLLDENFVRKPLWQAVAAAIDAAPAR